MGSSQASGNNIPKDLKEYIDNVEDCQHFSGEWDSDLPDEQKKEIEDGIDQYCTKAKELQKKLKKKYKNDIKKIEIIDSYDI
ncbi:hypothetical protein PSI23_15590 [Xenorhabdus sp. XENO-10]|uniref:Uncharacterized protein n=1 Tax=Xenorhabdus yunnanensis TaxID=3025878 RepID=A0ABT5LLN3_9GAMM|nr:hypothetical protein [Xenorhabdus yunnanensis]MDC9590670.1 hypothetical protein [Xenorhabdus yunnanensis]